MKCPSGHNWMQNTYAILLIQRKVDSAEIKLDCKCKCNHTRSNDAHHLWTQVFFKSTKAKVYPEFKRCIIFVGRKQAEKQESHLHPWHLVYERKLKPNKNRVPCANDCFTVLSPGSFTLHHVCTTDFFHNFLDKKLSCCNYFRDHLVNIPQVTQPSCL